METIDCRNLACPAPVIAVKKALQMHAEIQVLLEDGAPRENVTRYCSNHGCQVTEIRNGDAWLLTITRDSSGNANVPDRELTADRVLLITSDRIGDGPEELGRLLMKNFVHTLLETKELPARMLFMNTGVFLTCNGSDTLEALLKLHGMGVEIFSCGLCLDYFNLKGELIAGETTNMLMTAESLLSAGVVIKL